MNYRTIPEPDNKEYPLFITAEEKDKILTALLIKANGTETAILEYKDVCNLALSKDQYETVIKEFKQEKLIKSVGYGTRYTLLPKIHERRDKLGFNAEKEAYINSLEILSLQLSALEKNANPTVKTVLNKRIKEAKCLSDLIITLKGFSEFL